MGKEIDSEFKDLLDTFADSTIVDYEVWDDGHIVIQLDDVYDLEHHITSRMLWYGYTVVCVTDHDEVVFEPVKESTHWQGESKGSIDTK